MMMVPGKKILVVDDEQQLALAVKIRLQSSGYEVVTASDGKKGLELIEREQPDLVILDVLMPVMDGYEVYHLLRENPVTKEIPVIIVTAKGERKDRQLGLEGPTYNYLTKPFQIEELLAKVREVLHHSSVAS